MGYSIFKRTIADMSWQEVEKAVKRRAIMLVPIGVIEQHGPHLPLATDVYGAYLMCQLTKNELEKHGILSIIAAPYYFGISAGTEMFPGTIRIRKKSMITILTDILVSHKEFGFRKQFIMNHHYDPQHNDAIFQAMINAFAKDVEAMYVLWGLGSEATEQIYKSAFKKPLPLPESSFLTVSESDETRKAKIRLDKSKTHVHAEERETSMIMRWYANLLKITGDINNLKPITPTFQDFIHAALNGRWREVSPLGYIGDPSVASNENGQIYEYEARDVAASITKFLMQKT